MAASDSHTAYLARRAQKTRLTNDEYDTAVRRVAAIRNGAAEEWPGEERDRRAELDAPENCD